MSEQVKNWRVRCSWGDGSLSYFYFATHEEARDFYPEPKPRYGTFSGRVIGYRNPRGLTVQARGPRNGWGSAKAAGQ